MSFAVPCFNTSFSSKMRIITHICLPLLLLVLPSVAAMAQDEEYFNNAWYSCELSGRQTVWQITKYKVNVSNVFPLVEDRGTFTFSDDCIEINCENVQMHFPVKNYGRLNLTSFSIERNGEDDYFDYIEVMPVRQGGKGTFKIMMGLRDPDGTMQNTHIFVCKSKNGLKLPPQVPNL